MNSPNQQRLAQLVTLIDKESEHLNSVRHRLLGENCNVDEQRLQLLLANDIGIDRLESFGAKFARMQDSVVDKLIPAVLRQAGENAGAAIDNLTRMEKLELIASADDWLAMRGLRNRLIHEYIDKPQDLALTLQRACQFTSQMQNDYTTIREYTTACLGIGAPG